MSTTVETGPPPSIDELIPHRPPMRLLDRIESHNLVSVTATCTVSETWPFVRNGVARAVVLLEVMTEAAAAHFSLTSREIGVLPHGTPVVTTVRELVLERSELRVGETFFVESALEVGDGQLAIVRSEVRDADGRIATGRFTVGRFAQVRG